MTTVMNSVSQDNIIFLNKPSGITSNDAIQIIKRTLNVSKIGHAGTLDKFAKGLLICLTGKATKLSDLFLNLDKRYVSQIYFGKETSTLDPDGEVNFQADVPNLNTINEVLTKYLGELDQVPPKYSAIHVNGVRSSRLMRQGEDIILPSRRVCIYHRKIVSTNLPTVEIEWHVSKGTYIRALARDIGRDCNSCAHLSSLKRIQIGQWKLSQAIDLENLLERETLKRHSTQSLLDHSIMSIFDIFESMDNVYKIYTDDNQIRVHLQFGTQPLHVLKKEYNPSNDMHFVYICDKNGLVGVWKYLEGTFFHILTV